MVSTTIADDEDDFVIVERPVDRITSLPPEILILLFDTLSANDLSALMICCRTFRDTLCNHDAEKLWRRIMQLDRYQGLLHFSSSRHLFLRVHRGGATVEYMTEEAIETAQDEPHSLVRWLQQKRDNVGGFLSSTFSTISNVARYGAE